MFARVIRNMYFKFNYVLLITLGFMLIFNRFNPINETFSMFLVFGMIIIEMAIVVYVEFNEEETLARKFLRRFAQIDVLLAMILIIFYIGACNNWLDAM